MKNLILLCVLGFAGMSLGAKLEITAYETVGKEKVAQAAIINNIELKRVGTGIRQKRILFNINVYRASLFVSKPELFVKKIEGSVALNSLNNMNAYALDLKFLRNVEAEKILASFSEGLQINGVDNSPAIEQLKKAVTAGGEVKSGESIKISVQINPETKQGVLIYEHKNSVTEIKGDQKLFSDIFSIWLGKTNEENMTILRKALIGL